MNPREHPTLQPAVIGIKCTYIVDNVWRLFDIPPNEGKVPEVKLYDVPNTGEFEMNGPGRFVDGVAGE